MSKFKVEFWNGDKNGMVRYYESVTVARAVAKRYVRRCYQLSCSPYCEIYSIDKYRPAFFEFIDINSL